MSDTHAATCLQCGREFQTFGTLREALADTPEQKAAARAARDLHDAESGGPRGLCCCRRR